ncbi:MAG: DUF4388 domain-containing protein [Anaerolineales bacterium]
MALKGNLRDFSLTQLLNLIHLAHKNGILQVEDPPNSIWLGFRDGKLAYGGMNKEDNSLVAILYRSKKINANQYRTIKERTSSMSDKELGLLLVNAGYLSQQEIIQGIQDYLIKLVQRLFLWVEGDFTFENEAPLPADKILLRINLDNLILEGARQLKELEQLKDEIPSLDIALKFCDRPISNIRNLSLSQEEWKVVSYINPKNSLRKIAAAVNLNDLEMRRIAFGLLQAGVVELVKPDGYAPKQTIKPGIPHASPTEQVSLIKRIIQRIRSL